MAPVTFLQRPFTWLSAIARYGIDSSAAPNFAYDLCARKITAEQRDTLDLSKWTMTITGAEPVRAETIRRFVDAFGPCGVREELFCASYGLAESTLIVSSGEAGSAPRTLKVVERELEQHRVVDAGPEEAARTLVSSGRPVAEHQVRIVDPERLVECAPEVVGEIWVAGPSVAQGYWGQPEETERTFRARMADSTEGPFLRTGDFGFLRDGELYVTGRLKDLIIIDGRNHYPQDIELTVEGSHPVIRPNGVAAFAVEFGGEERLVIVAEAERRYLGMLRELKNAASDDGRVLDHGDPVKRAVRQAVSAEHDLRVHAIELVRPGSVPKTSSGKIRRSACRNGFLAGTLDRWDS
jgi:acyl-CoA synthetase (AMP-forming)/AMP-acid ligase II